MGQSHEVLADLASNCPAETLIFQVIPPIFRTLKDEITNHAQETWNVDAIRYQMDAEPIGQVHQMSKRQYRFHANLVPTTPLHALELHNTVRSTASPEEQSDGAWFEIGDLDATFSVFSEGGSMSSLVGYIPCEGGDLLGYLKEVRRIVEEPVVGETERIEDALNRVSRIRGLAPRRTYTFDKHFKLKPNVTLEDYCSKIFKKPNALLDFVLQTSYGIGYKSLNKLEKQRAKVAGAGSLKEEVGRSLEDQSRSLGWNLNQIVVEKLPFGRWRSASGQEGGPEEIVLHMLVRQGESGSFCEGSAIKALMKSASFEFLVENNLFNDRLDAARRYFEAQCTILIDRRNEIVDAIRSSTSSTVSRALKEVLAVADVGPSGAMLDRAFIERLYEALGPDKLASIAEIFVQRPYDYRAGWPDLTIIGPGGMRLIEVKTTDLFHDSQVRFAREVAAPLGFDCSVVQVVGS